MDLKEQANKRHEEARSAHAALAVDYEARLSELADDASADDIQVVIDEFTPQLDTAEDLVKRTKSQLESVSRAVEARVASAALIPQTSEGGTDVKVIKEPLTYSRDNPMSSYFRDLMNYQLRRGDTSGLERLQRNNKEVLVEAEERGIVYRDAEGRAMSSSAGAGGDFLPPLYFGELYAKFRRARRVTSRLVRNYPLAAHGNTITIPRVTAGTATAAQTADNQNLQTTDATTAILTVPVCTVAGYNDLSRQIVERSDPGFDQIVIEDLLADYNKKVNQYVVNGSGSAGQPLGILNVSGFNAITFTTGSPTVPLLYPKVLDSVRQISENVFEPTVGFVMTARRWAWILASLDSSNRPLAVVNGQGPFNALGLHNTGNASFNDNLGDGLNGSMVPAGWFAGYQVYVDETIPKTLGAGTNQDPIIAAAFGEHILWEDPAGPRQFHFEGVTSQTAAIRVQVFGYMAFTAGRYPAATSIINGTGLVAPTF